MQILNLEQGSDEWLQARSGLVTCSELDVLLVNGKGVCGFGTGAITYMNKIIGERMTGKPEPNFSNGHTDRGHTHEPRAIELYSLINDSEVESCGFIINKFVGYSPDGLVGKDGTVEVKSKLPKFQVEMLYNDEVPKEHVAQCQSGLWVSEREWCDFIGYCEGMPLFVKRLYRDEEYIKNLEDRVTIFYHELERRMDVISNLKH